MRRTSARLSWTLVVLYLALIYQLSATQFHSGLFQSIQKFHVDKIIHVVEYTFLGFLLARAFNYSPGHWRTSRLWFAVLVIGILYAASDEYHQSFVPSRDASAYDAFADALGLVFGCWIRAKYFAKKRLNRA